MWSRDFEVLTTQAWPDIEAEGPSGAEVRPPVPVPCADQDEEGPLAALEPEVVEGVSHEGRNRSRSRSPGTSVPAGRAISQVADGQGISERGPQLRSSTESRSSVPRLRQDPDEHGDGRQIGWSPAPAPSGHVLHDLGEQDTTARGLCLRDVHPLGWARQLGRRRGDLHADPRGHRQGPRGRHWGSQYDEEEASMMRKLTGAEQKDSKATVAKARAGGGMAPSGSSAETRCRTTQRIPWGCDLFPLVRTAGPRRHDS